MDLNPFDIPQEIADALVGGDVGALRNAAGAWRDLATALDQAEHALTGPVGALQGHKWNGESRDKFISGYWNPLQKVLQDNATQARAVAGQLDQAAKTIDEVKAGIVDIVDGIAISLLISIGAAILSAGLSALADIAEAAAIASRIALLLERLAVVLRALATGLKIFAKQNAIGLLVNMTVKLSAKFVAGPQGAFQPSNLLYFKPGEGTSLVVGDAIWGVGSVALKGLQGLSPASGLAGRVFSLQGPLRYTIGAGVINFGFGTGFAAFNGRSLPDSLLYGLESAAFGAGGGYAAAKISSGLLGLSETSPAIGNTITTVSSTGADLAFPSFAQSRKDAPPAGFRWPRENTSYPSLATGLPVAQKPGTVPVYTVKPGDNLWNIAGQQYPNHDPRQYPNIYWGTNANSHTQIANPNLIYPGEKILILPEQTSGGQVQPPLPVPSVNGYPTVTGASLPPAPPVVTHHLSPGGSNSVPHGSAPNGSAPNGSAPHGSAPHHQPGGSGIVTVRPGDTLSAIAERHHITLQQLEAANRSLGNPNLIYPGERVVIPGQRAA